MAKKVKSFNTEEEAYNSLFSMFKQYKSGESISSFLENCIKDLLEYLKEMEAGLKGDKNSKSIMKIVIDKTVKGAIINKPSWQYHENDERYGLNTLDGEPKIMHALTANSLEDLEWNKKDDEFEEELKAIENDRKKSELQFWKDEFEASEKGIPKSFAKFLRTGEYELSKSKRFIIEKKTGDRYIDLAGLRIVKVSKDLEIK